MFTIGITKGRWNTLLTALQQFKDDYDKNQPLWRILPEFCQQHPRYERMGLRDLCQHVHEMYAKYDIARLTTEMYLSDLTPAMKPSDAFATSRTARPSGWRSTSWKAASPWAGHAVPAGHSAADSRASVFNKKIVDYLKFAREFNASCSPASRPTSTAWLSRPMTRFLATAAMMTISGMCFQWGRRWRRGRRAYIVGGMRPGKVPAHAVLLDALPQALAVVPGLGAFERQPEGVRGGFGDDETVGCLVGQRASLRRRSRYRPGRRWRGRWVACRSAGCTSG
jgi:hypothetical protein